MTNGFVVVLNNILMNNLSSVLIYCFFVFAGRGRHMDAYVDNLFDNVLDQGPPVSDVRIYLFIANVSVTSRMF